MDDLEFRKRLYSDPASQDQDMIDAIKQDSARKNLADELNAFDDKILTAMKVEVPENLASQLILRQSLHAHQQTKKKSRIHLAMAASVAFAVGITVNFLTASPVYTNVADYSLAHYHHEAANFDNTGDIQYSLANFNSEMNDLNVSFSDKLGKLISIDGCYFDGMDSVHLVFEGKYDNVTVFIVPKSEHLKFSQQFNDETVQGVARQYQQGDVIIMGDRKETLELWQQKIDETIEWSI